MTLIYKTINFFLNLQNKYIICFNITKKEQKITIVDIRVRNFALIYQSFHQGYSLKNNVSIYGL